MLNFVKCFFYYICWIGHFFLSFILLTLGISLIFKCSINLHSWEKCYMIMYYSFYIVLDLICYSFVNFFVSYVYKGSWSVVFLICNGFIWIWHMVNSTFIKWGGNCSLLVYYLKEFVCRTDITSLNVCLNLSVKPVW